MKPKKRRRLELIAELEKIPLTRMRIYFHIPDENLVEANEIAASAGFRLSWDDDLGQWYAYNTDDLAGLDRWNFVG